MIVNYVLSEEYGGTRPRQVMAKEVCSALDVRQQKMCAFIDIMDK